MPPFARFHSFVLGLTLFFLLPPALAAAEGERVPLLVSIDDLPMSGGDLHTGPEGRPGRVAATDAMLAALAKHKVPAVALVTWSNVLAPDDSALLDRWIAAGHELGNHSDRHLDFHRTPTDAWIADVSRSQREIDAFLAARGKAPLRFFRFPFLREGDTDAKLDAARSWLAKSGQRNLPVSIDDQDWSFERPFVEATRAGDRAARDRVAEAYHESLHLSVRHHRASARALLDRDVPQILLLHATAIGGAEWDRLFTWLEGEGFRFATADEVLADPAYAMPHRFLGPRGPGLWDRLLDARRRSEADADVRKLFADQVGAWNRGDLDAFTSVYADAALFVSPGGVTRGRDEVLTRYKRRYPDGRAMGKLTLEIQELRLTAGGEVSMLGDAVPGSVHGARVVARWTLVRDGDLPTTSGPTLVVLERRQGRWWIVEDASMEQEPVD